MMPEVLSFSAAFMLGLAGSPHCVGMCGGIAGLLGASTQPQPGASSQTLAASTQPQRSSSATSGLAVAPARSAMIASDIGHGIHYSLLFQLGRIASYAMLGALLATGIQLFGNTAESALPQIGRMLRWLASGMLVVMALSIAGWGGLSTRLEKMGAVIWSRLRPVSRHLLPVDSNGKALAIGGLWGLMPCGMIYSALAWAALSANPLHSAALMACFGLGTAPSMLGIGGISGSFKSALRRPGYRLLFAGLLIALAILPLLNLGPAATVHHH